MPTAVEEEAPALAEAPAERMQPLGTSITIRRPPPFWEREAPPVATLEQRLARVPGDLQRALIERGRALERWDELQRRRNRLFEELRAADHQIQVAHQREMDAQRRDVPCWAMNAADWSACCAPMRAQGESGAALNAMRRAEEDERRYREAYDRMVEPMRQMNREYNGEFTKPLKAELPSDGGPAGGGSEVMAGIVGCGD